MTECKVHNVRFYKPKPKPIYCMSYNQKRDLLAVSRSNAFVEIWDVKAAPFVSKTIASSADNYSVEGLAWSDDRLFSVGLHGLLVEYDLSKLRVRSTTTVTGDAAFCLDVDPKGRLIAVGTEKGYMNVFRVADDEVVYDRFLDKQEGRILCLKFDCSGDFVASGSSDAVRIWDVAVGHVLHKMNLPKYGEATPIVWCLAVTEDFTVVSGDSRGRLTFWDGRVGAQIESYQSHRSDILSLTYCKQDKMVYCAGNDPVINCYSRVRVTDASHKWVRSIQRNVHEHDVRSLIVHKKTLYSGGLDGYLALSQYPPKFVAKYPPLGRSPCVVVAQKARYVLLKYPKHVQVWALGECENAASKECKYFKLAKESRKLLVLERQLSGTGGDGRKVRQSIVDCSVSNDGEWIAYSTPTTLRLFKFSYDCNEEGAQPNLRQVNDLPPECGSSLKLLFTPDSRTLISVDGEGNLHFIALSEHEPETAQTIKTDFADTIAFLNCSSCGNYLVAADCRSNVAVWKRIENGWKSYCKLPTHGLPVTALGVQPGKLNLVVAYADFHIVEFNLIDRRFTSLTKHLSNKPFSKKIPIRGITFDPRNDQVIILYDDTTIIIINKNTKTSTVTAKIPKIDDSTASDSAEKYGVHSIKKYQHLVHLGWLSNDEMVAVEVSPLSFLEQLRPSFNKEEYGTK